MMIDDAQVNHRSYIICGDMVFCSEFGMRAGIQLPASAYYDHMSATATQFTSHH